MSYSTMDAKYIVYRHGGTTIADRDRSAFLYTGTVSSWRDIAGINANVRGESAARYARAIAH